MITYFTCITFGLLSSSGDEGDGLLCMNPLLENTSWNCRSKITNIYINLVTSLQKEKRQTALHDCTICTITLEETTKRKKILGYNRDDVCTSDSEWSETRCFITTGPGTLL
jgi:hypothetical protein